MNIELNHHASSLATICIYGTAEDYQAKVDNQLKKISKNLNFKGFRSGKVPLNIIRQQHEKKLCVETINTLVEEQLKKYLEANTLNIIGHPQYNHNNSYINFDKNIFSYQFDIALYEEFKLNINKQC